MEKFESMTVAERAEITELFANWLRKYSHDVIVRVMERAEEIMNNTFTMNLLKELKEREDKERDEFSDSIRYFITNFEMVKKYDPHNCPTTHADSYRDVLYDMYIK